MSTVAHWKLRRLATRALKVIERNRDKQPAIMAWEAKLGASAQAVIDAYDRAYAYQTSRAGAVEGTKGKATELERKIRGWAALVEEDVPGFDRTSMGDRPDVPDDVLADAGRLLAVVAEYETKHGQALPYAEAIRADLEPAIEAVRAEWSAAGLSSGTYAEMLAASRTASDTFTRHLIAFRRTLRTHVGRGHPDYQKLRTARARFEDSDDDALGKSLPEGGPEEVDDEADELSLEELAEIASEPATGPEERKAS